jgi:hypothetical protein
MCLCGLGWLYSKVSDVYLWVSCLFVCILPNHSTVVQPLQALIPEYRRSNKLVWNAEARLVYDDIKQWINDCPTMYFVLPGGNFAYIYICLYVCVQLRQPVKDAVMCLCELGWLLLHKCFHFLCSLLMPYWTNSCGLRRTCRQE